MLAVQAAFREKVKEDFVGPDGVKIARWIERRPRSPTPEMQADKVCNAEFLCDKCTSTTCTLPVHEGGDHGCLTCATFRDDIMTLVEKAEKSRNIVVNKEVKAEEAAAGNQKQSQVPADKDAAVADSIVDEDVLQKHR